MKTGEYLKKLLLNEPNHTHTDIKVTGFAFPINLFCILAEDSNLL